MRRTFEKLNHKKRQQYTFSLPFMVIIASLATCVFIWILSPLPRFSGERRSYLFYYHAPIVFVFVFYFFDRAKRRIAIPLYQWVIDAIVILVALIRAVFHFPPISGHALFLTYVLLTAKSKLLFYTAAMMFVVVVYMKTFILHDLTLIGGTMGGLCAAGLLRLFPIFAIGNRRNE
ncbi:MAG: hypothetical protein WHX52_21955 [Anaerolineae bacterium]